MSAPLPLSVQAVGTWATPGAYESARDLNSGHHPCASSSFAHVSLISYKYTAVDISIHLCPEASLWFGALLLPWGLAGTGAWFCLHPWSTLLPPPLFFSSTATKHHHLTASKSDITYASFRLASPTTFPSLPLVALCYQLVTQIPHGTSHLCQDSAVYAPLALITPLPSLLLFLLFLPQPPHILLLCTALPNRQFTFFLSWKKANLFTPGKPILLMLLDIPGAYTLNSTTLKEHDEEGKLERKPQMDTSNSFLCLTYAKKYPAHHSLGFYTHKVILIYSPQCFSLILYSFIIFFFWTWSKYSPL